jgi:hypothetical protein
VFRDTVRNGLNLLKSGFVAEHKACARAGVQTGFYLHPSRPHNTCSICRDWSSQLRSVQLIRSGKDLALLCTLQRSVWLFDHVMTTFPYCFPTSEFYFVRV